MAAVIFLLCALTSLACTVVLWRNWRKNGHRLIFWCSLCFALLTLNNLILVIDEVVLDGAFDLRPWRLTVGLLAFVLLVFGLVWEED